MLTLIFAIRASEPPPPPPRAWRTTEKAGPDSVKLYLTKVDIKSVIRDYSLKNYVANVQSLKTCKLSKCSVEISEDPKSH